MSSSSLEVPRRQRPAKRPKLWRIVIVLATLAVAVGWAIWFLRTPEDLPTSSGALDGGGVVDQEVYLGMFTAGDDFDRTIEVSEVAVDVTADADVEVLPQICRGGSLSVTTDAEPFCPELADVEGAELSDGDSIVLVVTAAEPTDVEIGRIEVSFRDGIRWGTDEAGIEGATLTIADHEPGTVVEDPDSDDTTTDRPEPDDDKPKKKKDENGQGDGA